MKAIMALVVAIIGSIIGGAIGCLAGMFYGMIKAFDLCGIEIELPKSTDSSEKDQI